MKWILILLSSLFWFHSYGETNLKKAYKYYTQEKFEKALTIFEEELKIDSNNINLRYNVGLCHEALHNTGEAIYAFEKIIQTQPDNYLAKEQIERTLVLNNSDLIWKPRSNMFMSKLYSLPISFWFSLSIIFILIASASIIYLFLSHSERVKFLAKLVLFVSLLLVLITIAFSAGQANYFKENHFGIILKNKPIVLDDSNEKVEVAFLEGERIQIESIEDDFIWIRHENKNLYKLNQQDIGVI